MHYGLPEHILSDQGRNFKSSLIAELCQVSKIKKKLRTSPYRSQTNGQCNQFNATLISILSTLPNDAQTRWQDHVPTWVHAYNCSHSNAAGFSPYFLIYRRHLMLTTDVELGVWTPDILTSTTHPP